MTENTENVKMERSIAKALRNDLAAKYCAFKHRNNREPLNLQRKTFAP